LWFEVAAVAIGEQLHRQAVRRIAIAAAHRD
jgi:hypothetical protein